MGWVSHIAFLICMTIIGGKLWDFRLARNRGFVKDLFSIPPPKWYDVGSAGQRLSSPVCARAAENAAESSTVNPD
jgi:hypothetical protein